MIVYEDLLLFYAKTITLFERSRFILRVALDALKPAIGEIVSSFNKHADILSGLLETESFASIQEIKDEQVETLSMSCSRSPTLFLLSFRLLLNSFKVRDTLDRGREHEWSYHNEFKRRTDAACSWITCSDSFSYWLLNAKESNLLALFGEMGYGKTITTAFVADTLARNGRPLCAYYCKDDQESAKLGNIYRSILLQFLRRKPILKARFSTWYKETSPLVPCTPTQSDEKLRELLYDIISSSREPVFLVLDALDECKVYVRKQLFSLFRDLMKNNAPLKIFMSSRYDSEIEADLPPGFTKMELRPSRRRDRAIAAFLVAGITLPAAFQERVVEELTLKSHGSAIWLRIAVEYIAGSRIQNQKGLAMALNRLPSSKGLAELYGKLFEKISEDIADNKMLLQRALEILAVARRPLTLEELASVVFVTNPVGEDATTFSELDELAHSIDLLSLVRPFVSASTAEGGQIPRLRLVHLSLKQLLLAAPPSEWCSAEAMARRRKGGRAEELDADLLGRCIKYLLFDECLKGRLLPSCWDDEGGLFAIGDPFGDHDGDDTNSSEVNSQTPTSATSSLSRLPSADFDPSELGFGHFFAYAAAYWTVHFSDVTPERRPDPHQLAALCQKDSQRLENWVQQWRRPSCGRIPERDFPAYDFGLDPLVIAAQFGPAASVTDLLDLHLDGSVLAQDSVWTAIPYLTGRGLIAAVGDLVHDETLGPTLVSCKFLYRMMPEWRWSTVEPGNTNANASKELEDIFGFVISHVRGDLLECGNDMLRRAAQHGCLGLIQKLFEAAETDPDLLRALLVPEAGQSSGGWNKHQSIGEAAFEGHADVVRFLCEQPGLSSHLHHRNQLGYTVFHLAPRSTNAENVFRVLIRHWPEGVDIEANGGETPLDLSISMDSSTSEARVIRIVRLLIHEGKASTKRREGYSPLCTAVRGGYTQLLRVLVTEGGADVSQVVGVDEVTGRPFLLPGMDTWEDKGRREEMLKVLCCLVPLATSIEYLV